MHDEASPHFLRTGRQHLNRTSGEQWIRRRCPVNWPTQPPDHNPMHIWLLGHQNTSMYTAPINDLQVSQQRVQYAY
jgi:hypothetical protein